MRSISILASFVLIFSATVHADEIRLKNGRVLEGRVVGARIVDGRPEVAEHAMVTVERPYGLIKIEASRILEVKICEDDFDRFDERRTIAGDDLAALLELAQWCEERKLRHRMKELVAEILEIEPDLEEARALNGEVMTEDGWQKASRVKREQRAAAKLARKPAKSKAAWRKTEREMRRLASQIYSQSAAESKTAYLRLLALADAENIGGLKPIAARFYRDAADQRAALASGRVTINLQQASVTSLRERSLNLGAGGAVRVQLPETRKIGLGTTVSVPFR